MLVEVSQDLQNALKMGNKSGIPQPSHFLSFWLEAGRDKTVWWVLVGCTKIKDDVLSSKWRGGQFCADRRPSRKFSIFKSKGSDWCFVHFVFQRNRRPNGLACIDFRFLLIQETSNRPTLSAGVLICIFLNRWRVQVPLQILQILPVFWRPVHTLADVNGHLWSGSFLTQFLRQKKVLSGHTHNRWLNMSILSIPQSGQRVDLWWKDRWVGFWWKGRLPPCGLFAA